MKICQGIIFEKKIKILTKINFSKKFDKLTKIYFTEKIRKSLSKWKGILLWSWRSGTPSILLGLTPSLCTDTKHNFWWYPKAKTQRQDSKPFVYSFSNTPHQECHDTSKSGKFEWCYLYHRSFSCFSDNSFSLPPLRPASDSA